jgi:hypothetical protein
MENFDAYNIVLWDLQKRRDLLTKAIEALETLCSLATISKATSATTTERATEEATATTGAIGVVSSTDACASGGEVASAAIGILSKEPNETQFSQYAVSADEDVTAEQVAAVEKLVAPEFADGDWRTVEQEK